MNETTAVRRQPVLRNRSRLPREREACGSPAPFAAWSLAEPDGPPPPRVAWVQERPLTLVGGWEPVSFRIRAGYAWEDEAEYAREVEFSDRELDTFRDLGCHCIHIPYAKGFGLQATSEELSRQRDIIRRAHARGLRVALYIRMDYVMPDILVREQPGVYDWLTRGMYDRPANYSASQCFRKRICHLHPGALAWLESLLRHAVAEMRADTLHLDGFFVAYYPWETCRCERCVTTYRLWLKRKYADPQLARRVFGLIDFDRLAPPEFEPNAPLPAVLTTPEIRAWHEHQWDKQLAFLRHVRRFVRALNPEVAIFPNMGWYRNFNYYRQLSICPERLFPWSDFVALEDDFELSYRKGRIVSRLGMFKTAREYGLPVVSYHHSADPHHLAASMALYLAANGGNISLLGFTLRYYAHHSVAADVKRRLVQWAERHWDLLRETRPAGELGLVRHHPSLAWNARQPWAAAMGLEHLLTRMQIPWRMIDRLETGALRGLTTLLLADAECLSAEELTVLQRWVEQGGRLFFTFRTGLFNGHRQRRARHPILDWSPQLKAAFNDRIDSRVWFEWSSEDYNEQLTDQSALAARPVIRAVGPGRLGFWPRLRVAIQDHTLARRILADDIRLPDHAPAVEKFIRQLHGPFEYAIQAPDSVLVEWNRHRELPITFLHLVNVKPTAEAVNVTIRLRDAPCVPCELLSPDVPPPKLTVRGATLRIRKLYRYAVVVLHGNPERR